MQTINKLLQSTLLAFLIHSVVIETAFVAVVLSVYDGVPVVAADSGLVEVIRVFEE